MASYAAVGAFTSPSSAIFAFRLSCGYICIFHLVFFECRFPDSPVKTKGALHLSELTGQDISSVMRILFLIKAIQPDQSNPK